MLVAGPVRASHQPDKVERGVVPVFFFFFLQIFLFYWVGIHEAMSGRQTRDSVVGLSHIDSQRPSANTQGGDGGRARMLALVMLLIGTSDAVSFIVLACWDLCRPGGPIACYCEFLGNNM